MVRSFLLPTPSLLSVRSRPQTGNDLNVPNGYPAIAIHVRRIAGQAPGQGDDGDIQMLPGQAALLPAHRQPAQVSQAEDLLGAIGDLLRQRQAFG